MKPERRQRQAAATEEKGTFYFSRPEESTLMTFERHSTSVSLVAFDATSRTFPRCGRRCRKANGRK